MSTELLLFLKRLDKLVKLIRDYFRHPEYDCKKVYCLALIQKFNLLVKHFENEVSQLTHTENNWLRLIRLIDYYISLHHDPLSNRIISQ